MATQQVDIVPPPRASGNPTSDAFSIGRWLHDFYEAAIIQGGLIGIADLGTELQSQFPILYDLGTMPGTAADKLAYFSAENDLSLTDFTPNAQLLLAKTTTADMLTFLGASNFSTEDVQDIVGALIQNSTTITWTYNDGANTLSAALASFTGLTTADLTEGANLYFTNERVDDRVAVLLQSAGGITWTYSDAGNTLTPALDQVTASGTYTPSLTIVTNLDAVSAHPCQYLRVGSTVTVSGKFDADATAAGTIRLRMTLPIASNIGQQYEIGGVASVIDVGGQVLGIRGDAANNEADIVGVVSDTANRSYYFSFTYQII